MGSFHSFDIYSLIPFCSIVELPEITWPNSDYSQSFSLIESTKLNTLLEEYSDTEMSITEKKKVKL